jgi:hypothetical protein
LITINAKFSFLLSAGAAAYKRLIVGEEVSFTIHIQKHYILLAIHTRLPLPLANHLSTSTGPRHVDTMTG